MKVEKQLAVLAIIFSVIIISTACQSSSPDITNKLATSLPLETKQTRQAPIKVAPTPTKIRVETRLVYLIPTTQGKFLTPGFLEKNPDPYTFVIEFIRFDNEKLFSQDKVNNCNVFMSRELNHVVFDPLKRRHIKEAIVCGGEKYYLIRGIDEWDFWVHEDQISKEIPLTDGFRYHIQDQYPKKHLKNINDEVELSIRGEPISITLKNIEFIDWGDYGKLQTEILMENKGAETVTIIPEYLIDIKEGSGVRYKKGETPGKNSWVQLLDLDPLQLDPGIQFSITLSWEMFSHSLNSTYYMSINSPIDREGTVLIKPNMAIYSFKFSKTKENQ